MNGQNLLAPGDVGQIYEHLAVEAARAQQRRVEDVGPVGGGNNDDVGLVVEAVHFDQDLVERLLALVVAAAHPRAALAADGVNLVHKDDGRRGLLGLLEQVADAAGANADEHLHKLGTGDVEEGHARLAGHGAGQQRFARARRPNHQHTLGDACADLDELLRLAQELDDLDQLQLGLFHAGYVVEGDGRPVGVGQVARPAAAEAEDVVAAAALHLPEAAREEPQQQQYRADGEGQAEQRVPHRVVLDNQFVVEVFGGDAVVLERLDETVGGGLDRAEVAAVVQRHLEPVTADDQLLHLVFANKLGDLLEGYLLRAAEAAAEPQLQPQDHSEDCQNPDPGWNMRAILVRLFIHSALLPPERPTIDRVKVLA